MSETRSRSTRQRHPTRRKVADRLRPGSNASRVSTPRGNTAVSLSFGHEHTRILRFCSDGRTEFRQSLFEQRGHFSDRCRNKLAVDPAPCPSLPVTRPTPHHAFGYDGPRGGRGGRSSGNGDVGVLLLVRVSEWIMIHSVLKFVPDSRYKRDM